LIPFAFVSPFRWLLLLVYPLSFYVTESITLLKSHKWKRFKLSVFRIALFYITISTAILSAGFIFNSPEQPFIYFNPRYLNSFQYQIPTSMQQNTISIADFQGTANVLQWFKDSENGSSILLTHTVFYGWASLTIDDHQIRTYGFDEPTHAAMIAKQEGNEVFLIWWRSGEGWYAQSSLPSVFQEVYHSGRMAIYQYSVI